MQSYLLFVSVLLTSGCLNYDEEMWLNADLSGSVSMKISLSEEIVKSNAGLERDISEQGVRSDVEKIPGVKLVSFESFRESGNITAKAKITFDDVEKLTRHEKGILDSSPVSMLGAITVTENGRKMTFDRSLNAMPEVKGKSLVKDLLARSVNSLLFSKDHINYKVHIPGEIITANSQHINGPDHVVEWQYTLAQAMREPPVMQVEWEKRFPFVAVVSWGVIVTTVLALLMWWRNRSRTV